MASSMTTVDVAILSIGLPSIASVMALPMVIATSSMRWWSLSPVAFMAMSNEAYLARVSTMCLRNWMSHSTSNFPVPSMPSSTEMSVSRVLRSTFADLPVIAPARAYVLNTISRKRRSFLRMWAIWFSSPTPFFSSFPNPCRE